MNELEACAEALTDIYTQTEVEDLIVYLIRKNKLDSVFTISEDQG